MPVDMPAVIQQVRLNSVPRGSAESLRRAYKSEFDCLVRDYTTYLRRNIHETAAAGPKTKQTDSAQQQTDILTNLTCKGIAVFNDSTGETATSSGSPNETANATKPGNARKIWRNEESRTDFKCVGNQVDGSAGKKGDGDVGVPGMLIIEPLRNVSHNVLHHPCQSPAIQQALVTHIMKAQDLESNRNLFQLPEKLFHSLLRQRGDFELWKDWTVGCGKYCWENASFIIFSQRCQCSQYHYFEEGAFSKLKNKGIFESLRLFFSLFYFTWSFSFDSNSDNWLKHW